MAITVVKPTTTFTPAVVAELVYYFDYTEVEIAELQKQGLSVVQLMELARKSHESRNVIH